MLITDSINYLLNQVSTVYYSDLERVLRTVELHSGQIFVLVALWEKNDRKQNDLAKSIGVSAPTVNKMIKSLERNGFVLVRRDETDTRIVRVRLTEKGESIRFEVEKLWEEMEAKMYSSLTETEKIVLSQLLRKIGEDLIN